MAVPGARAKIQEAVLAWEGVTAHPHRFGGTEFQLGNVIKCWTEGVQMMKVGGKARLVCPSNLAYGDDGIPGSVPRYAELTFEVELLDIK